MPAAIASDPVSQPDGTTIVRLRIAPTALDPLILRLRAAAALEATTLAPSHLPPAAILCVRSLADPRPGSIDLNATQPFGTQRSAPLWQQAMTARLDEMASRAAHPLRQPVPSDCEAVLFADRSELLACLARDWLSGQLQANWWWAHLLRKTGAREALLRAWLESPVQVPQAISHLVSQSKAVAFVTTLSIAEVQQLTSLVVERFALGRHLTPYVTENATAPAHPIENRPQLGKTAVDPANIRPPWHDLSPLTATQLSAAGQLFLGLSLCLTYRASTMRISSFGRQIQRWLRSLEDLSGYQVSPSSGPLLEGTREEPPPGANSKDGGLSMLRIADRATRTGDGAPGDTAPASGSADNPVDDNALPPTRVTQDTDRAIASSAAEPDDEQQTPVALTGGQPRAEVVTQFGGLFFLVNLALRMELYADFSSPEPPSLDLPIWDLLALVGERLISSELREDPLWDLLARLSGREQDPVADTDWLERLVNDIRERLLFGLGLENEADLDPILFHHPARIMVSAAQIDVMFQMDEIFGTQNSALPVRVAGLDRDPGWIPTACHTIRFHFT